MAKLLRQNFYQNQVIDARLAMTLLGIEYEFEWQVPSVPNNGSVFIRITASQDKFTVVNFRDIRHDRTFGFYRQYRQFDDSGATVGAPIPLEPMRGDTSVPSQTLIEPITGVVVDPSDAFSEIPLWGAGTFFNIQGAGGGLSRETDVRVIPPGAVVLLEFENVSGDPAYWYAYFKQYEIRPGALPETTDL